MLEDARRTRRLIGPPVRVKPTAYGSGHRNAMRAHPHTGFEPPCDKESTQVLAQSTAAQSLENPIELVERAELDAEPA